MSEIEVTASVDNLREVIGFLGANLENTDCAAAAMPLEIASEEIFVNICSYAYSDGTGKVRVEIETENAPRSVKITFTDNGIPYDPLAKEDQDITLPIEERQIGGLGIFMVKQFVDDIKYEYRDGQNVLTLTKLL